MSFSSSNDSDEVMGEINMTPLVDVMLVLLIVFIITVPVMNHSIQVSLPQASSQREEIKPETLRLAVDAAGEYNLNGSPITAAELPSVLQAEAKRDPVPDLHISGDKAVRYEHVAKAMAIAQQAGLKKIGFVTEPVK
ncbi:ExbD/TolR family protein [Hylemonella gracilis]|uniref:Biopolymer transport protein ExbD/TolR n=1 Tax=Hylemonella gracilis ATCC 19624 TaxID=887062 RepID=F3KQV7_9BURK|nr:biopolymer transporter ExbD [Hylemonella gracilis]EGI77877.1 biopolymer transport protein ExbD/TolR [Hylemonella gracilis ATCC 19624]